MCICIGYFQHKKMSISDIFKIYKSDLNFDFIRGKFIEALFKCETRCPLNIIDNALPTGAFLT